MNVTLLTKSQGRVKQITFLKTLGIFSCVNMSLVYLECRQYHSQATEGRVNSPEPWSRRQPLCWAAAWPRWCCHSAPRCAGAWNRSGSRREQTREGGGDENTQRLAGLLQQHRAQSWQQQEPTQSIREEGSGRGHTLSLRHTPHLPDTVLLLKHQTWGRQCRVSGLFVKISKLIVEEIASPDPPCSCRRPSAQSFNESIVQANCGLCEQQLSKQQEDRAAVNRLSWQTTS